MKFLTEEELFKKFRAMFYEKLIVFSFLQKLLSKIKIKGGCFLFLFSMVTRVY